MKNVNKKLYEKKGFTLAEMLLTVSIIIILGAVIAVNVIRYRQNLKLTEMDNAAREIYMAAQNHLSESVSTGEWGEIYAANADSTDKAAPVKTSESGTSASESSSSGQTKTDPYLGTFLGNKLSDVGENVSEDTSDSDTNHAFYYLIVNSKSDLEKDNAIKEILPKGAIDETVRQGAYIIEYDALLGQIYDVFYTDSKVSLTFAKTVNKLDSEIKSSSDAKSRSDSKSLRKQFTISSKKIALGYYGGATASDNEYKGEKITVDVKNENRLYLIVNVPKTITNDFTIRALNATDNNNNITVTLKDLRSDAHIQGTLQKAPVSTSTTTDGVTHYIYILDSPVEDGYGITDTSNIKWDKSASSDTTAAGTSSTDSKTFYVGDNLRATVTINTKKTNSTSTKTTTFKAKSAKFNSAFADGSSDTNARITNGRHLQNLAIASSADKTSTPSNNASNHVTNVKILQDITWHIDSTISRSSDDPASDFFAELNAELDKNKDNSIAKEYNIEDLNTDLNVKDNYKFTSIKSASIKNVTGSVKRASNSTDPDIPILSDFQISDNDAYNGLFANMTSDSLTIKKLSLKNFCLTNVDTYTKDDGTNANVKWADISTQTGKKICAGSLLGSFTGNKLTIDQVTSDNVYENFTSDNGIISGGLIGYISLNKNANEKGREANITDCHASVASIKGDNTYSGTGLKNISDIISVTNIGGLIGSTDSASVSVKRSYSSGRTEDGGVYNEDNPNLQVTNGNVGGFIGNAKANFTSQYNYSTCSVGAEINIGHTFGSCGGFVGYSGNSSRISWSYATGKVIVLSNTNIKEDQESQYTHFGQFIGQTIEENKVSEKIKKCFVLKGVNADIMPTLWFNETKAADFVEIKVMGSQDDGLNPFKVSDKVMRNAKPVDSKLQNKYPYCTTRQLVELADNATLTKASDEKEVDHVGDWPVAEDTQGVVGLMYYEGIQKKNSSSSKDIQYYYHGYWENLSKDHNNYSPTEINDPNNIPDDPDGYVVDDGYIVVLKVDPNRDNTTTAPNNVLMSDTNTFIGIDEQYYSLKEASELRNQKKISDNFNINGNSYKFYYIYEPDESNEELKTNINSLYNNQILNVYVRATDSKTDNNVIKYASFNVNLLSADTVLPASKPQTDNSITVRSARQLYNLFWDASSRKESSYLGSTGATINQAADIDFEQKFTVRAGQDSINYIDKLKKIDKSSLPFACTYNGNNHSINGLNVTKDDNTKDNLFGGTSTGTLQDLTLTKVTANSLFTKNNGTISNVTINDANIDSCGFAQENDSKITNSSIINARIKGNGAVETNVGQITGTNLINVKVSKSGFAETNNGMLVDDHIYADRKLYEDNIGYNSADSNNKKSSKSSNKTVNNPLFILEANDPGGQYPDSSAETYNLYNLTTIGFAYKSSDASYTDGTGSIGGFVNTNSGDIYGCSVTGTVCATAKTGGFAAQSTGKSDNSNNNSNIQGNYANVVIRTGNNNSRDKKQIKDGKYAAGFIGTATGTNISDNMVTGVILIKKNNNGNDNRSMSGFINQLDLTNATNGTNTTPAFSNNYSLIWCMNASMNKGNNNGNKDSINAFCAQLIPNNVQTDNLQNNGWLKTTDTMNYTEGTIGKGYGINATSDSPNDSIINTMLAADSSENTHFTSASGDRIKIYNYTSDEVNNSIIVPYSYTYDVNSKKVDIVKYSNGNGTPQTWYGDYYIEGVAEKYTNQFYGKEFGVKLTESQTSTDAKAAPSFSDETDSSTSTSESDNTPPISVNLAYIYQMIVQKKGLLFLPKMKAFF